MTSVHDVSTVLNKQRRDQRSSYTLVSRATCAIPILKSPTTSFILRATKTSSSFVHLCFYFTFSFYFILRPPFVYQIFSIRFVSSLVRNESNLTMSVDYLFPSWRNNILTFVPEYFIFHRSRRFLSRIFLPFSPTFPPLCSNILLRLVHARFSRDFVIRIST